MKIIVLLLLYTIGYNPKDTSKLLPVPTLSSPMLSVPFTLAPVRLEGGLILTEAYVNGKKGLFIIDTGAPGLVLNQGVFTSSDTSLEIVEGISSSIEVRKTDIDHFQWAGVQKKKVETLIVDLSHLEAAFNLTISGLIGYDILKDYELVVDYHFGLAQLFEAKKKDYYNAIEIPFTLEAHLPVIEATICNKKLKFGLDTGSESNLLDRRYEDLIEAHLTQTAIGGSGNPRMPVEEIRGLDQQIKKVNAFQLDVTRVYGQNFADMKYLMYPLREKCALAGIEIDGLLGFPFFRKGKFAINYKKKKLYFFPQEASLLTMYPFENILFFKRNYPAN